MKIFMSNLCHRNRILYLVRKYTTKAKRSLLLQDTDSIQSTYCILLIIKKNKNTISASTYPKSAPDKLRVYVWGFAETGALGVQTSLKKHAEKYTSIIHYPTRLKFAENCSVTDITAGYGFTAFAVQRSDGELLFGTGINGDGQLGLQERSKGGKATHLDLVIYPTPIKLPRKSEDQDEDMKIHCMSAGRAHLVVVNKKGVIFTLGNNAYGQCGRPIVEKELYRSSGLIHRIEDVFDNDDSVAHVECGQDHTIFLTKKGKVYSCGWGADGQTGQGTFTSSGDIKIIKGDIENEKIVKVSCSSDCVLALNDKGDVFGWGNSEYGQLSNRKDAPPQVNIPEFLDITKGFGKISDIAAGGSFCMILNDEGDVFSWGYGILGFGPNVEQTSKLQRLLPPLFGRSDFNPNSRVESIHCGVFHMGAINTEGDLFMWGKNRFGCLGLGHKKDQYFPFKTAVNGKVLKVSCGVDHTVALCKPFI